MECTCIRQTELPGTTSLFRDLVYHPDRTAQYFPRNLEAPEYPESRRAGLVAALTEQNPGSPLPQILAQPGTVAVVTGQQVGLFSGPAYTLYKALTAIKLAEELTRSGTTAVPIFWLATEDHDFAEVNQAWVFDSQSRPTRLETSSTPGPNQPVGSVPAALDISQLREAMRGLPWADEVTALAQNAYTPGATFGQAFAALLRSMLPGRELLLLDPLFPAIRQLAAPMLAEAVLAAEPLTRSLLERNRELEAAGYHAQVHIEAHTSLFFLLEGGQRIALRRQNGAYTAHGTVYTPEDLRARAAELSPNALLRPVIQDYMIPTHTYVGGPAELSYLAQSGVLYRELLGRQPEAVHRAGFTLVDAHSHKLMSRYGLTLPAFFAGETALRERIARTLVPASVETRLRQTRQQVAAAAANLKAELLQFDPTLAKALNRSARKVEYQLEKIGRKVARQQISRDERASSESEMLSNLIFPHRHLQERFYSILPLLAKHGLGLVGQLYEQLQLSCPDHQLLTV